MNTNGLFGKVVWAAIAAALVKLAFFPSANAPDLVSRAHAQSSAIVEWKDSRRLVTSGNDGATTYVWDYDEKTKVRKYSIKNGKLSLESYRLDE